MGTGAGFMHTRTGPAYPADTADHVQRDIRDAKGDQITTGRFPVVNVNEAWDLYSMLGITAPGYRATTTRKPKIALRTAWMIHPDGSWARATAICRPVAPVIHQTGPRRLWVAP